MVRDGAKSGPGSGPPETSQCPAKKGPDPRSVIFDKSRYRPRSGPRPLLLLPEAFIPPGTHPAVFYLHVGVLLCVFCLFGARFPPCCVSFVCLFSSIAASIRFVSWRLVGVPIRPMLLRVESSLVVCLRPGSR